MKITKYKWFLYTSFNVVRQDCLHSRVKAIKSFDYNKDYKLQKDFIKLKAIKKTQRTLKKKSTTKPANMPL